jgi:hypothetical protein
MAMKDRSSHWWIQNLLRPVLVAGMLACLATPLAGLVEYWFEGWNGTTLLTFAFFAGLEGILSERALRKQRVTSWGHLASRGAEALVLLIVLKLVSYVPGRLDQLWADALQWQTDPNSFLDGRFTYVAFLFLGMWVCALHVARQLGQLDVAEAQGPAPTDRTSIEYYLWLDSMSEHDREAGLEWLATLFVWGGSALLVASTVMYALLPSARTLAIPILLYFALGLALLGQGHFSVLHARWRAQGIPIQRGIARRWLLWALLFIGGVALVALLLPASYGAQSLLALVALLGQVLLVLYQVMIFIIYLLIFLLFLPFFFLFPSVETPPPPRFEPLSPLTPGQLPTGQQSPLLELVATALFWIIALAIMAYAAYHFARDRFDLLSNLEKMEGGWLGRLQVWLRGLRQWWRAWWRDVQPRRQQRRGRQRPERTTGLAPFRFVALRRLSPRELIRYFYLSTERRAARAGQPRRADQTPYEYRAALDRRFPDLEPDLEGLTDAFVKARYSPQVMQKPDAEATKPFWQRLKAALRQWRARS